MDEIRGKSMIDIEDWETDILEEILVDIANENEQKTEKRAASEKTAEKRLLTRLSRRRPLLRRMSYLKAAKDKEIEDYFQISSATCGSSCLSL